MKVLRKILGAMIVVFFMAPFVYLFERFLTGLIGGVGIDIRLYQALVNTLGLIVAVSLVSLFLGFFLAFAVVRWDFPGRRIWNVLLPMPFVIPSYVFAFVFLSLGFSGLTGFWGSWVVLVLVTYPHVFVNVRAALANLDGSLEEVAFVLGKSNGVVLRTVILPLVRPAVLASFLLVSLYVLSDFGAVSLFNFNTLTREVYFQFAANFDREQVFMGVGVLMVLAILLVLAALNFQSKFLGKAIMKKVDLVKRRELGVWGWGVALLCFAVVGVAVFLPFVTLLWWLVRGLVNGNAVQAHFVYAFNSVGYSLVAGVLSLLLMGVVVWIMGRRSSVFNRFLQGGLHLGYSIPGVVIGLVFVVMVLGFAPALYQSYGVLLAAYLLHFGVQALGPLRQNFLSLNPHYLEVCQSLGKSRFRGVYDVFLPLMKKGMVAGGLMVFMSVMRELPITLLLAPIGFDTLATHIWATTNEAFFTEAALSGLILVLISLVGSLIVSRE